MVNPWSWDERVVTGEKPFREKKMSVLWIRFEKKTKPYVTKYHAFKDDNYLSMCKREPRKKSKGKQLKNKPNDNALICSACRNLA